jgi:histidinol-phosphate/aromatic aminotransferase/cobyric acid decarboxylase-like protein
MLYDQIQRKGKSIESCESSPNSNENPLPVSHRVRMAIEQAITEVGRYPDGNGFEKNLRYLPSALFWQSVPRRCAHAPVADDPQYQ